MPETFKDRPQPPFAEGKKPEAPTLEKKEPSKGFQVEVYNPDRILEAIKKRRSGLLGRVELSQPIYWANVSLTGGKDEPSISVEIDTVGYNEFLFVDDDNKRRTERTDRNKIFKGIAGEYPGSTELNLNYLFRGRNGTNLVMPAKYRHKGIAFHTGTREDVYNNKTHSASLEALEGPEEMNSTLEDVRDLLRVSVQHLYKLEGEEQPSETLVISPPEWESESDSSDNSEEKTIFKRPTQAKRPFTVAPRMSTAGPESGIYLSELLRNIKEENPQVSFDHVGGQEEALSQMRLLAFGINNPNLYKERGIEPPKGILLYGPPGTGKTLMAKALASNVDGQFFNVKVPDIVDKFFGNSERNVKAIFDLAFAYKGKTVIFFDEIDSIFPSRKNSHEAPKRMVGTMLKQIERVYSNDKVIVVAATNLLENIDSALVRPGRFNRKVKVGLPDESGRGKIFDIHKDKVQKKANEFNGEEDEQQLFGELNYDEIIARTQGSSGADIEEIVRRSIEQTIFDEYETGESTLPVNTENILKQVDQFRN